MSAFMCSAQCFKNVAMYIIADNKIDEPFDTLLLQLVRQNQISLDERYHEYGGEPDSMKAMKERLSIVLEAIELPSSGSAVQRFKSAVCWLYRSCEGIAVTTEMVEEMTNKNDMRSHPDYDDAKWG